MNIHVIWIFSEYGIHLRVQLFNSVTKISIPDGAIKACLHISPLIWILRHLLSYNVLKTFLKLSKHMALHVVGASGEFKQRGNKGI